MKYTILNIIVLIVIVWSFVYIISCAHRMLPETPEARCVRVCHEGAKLQGYDIGGIKCWCK
jgi:hypothetical protein